MDVPDQHPIIEAHRGASDEGPENTLCAFRRAVAAGAPSIELDVHETRDGELVVMHDETVKRTTGSEGRIAEMTLGELRLLECGGWKDPRFRGEPIPTLEQALALSPAHGVCFNVEVKAFARAENAARLAGLLRGALPGNGRSHVVSSFHLEALLQVQRADDGIPLALLGKFPAILATALEHGFPWIHGQFEGATPEVVAEAHRAGLRVMIWTLNDPGLFDAYAGMGVDKICTDRPGTMLEARSSWLRRAGAQAAGMAGRHPDTGGA
ncbi:MAG: glycerophosphodiester phosphodiesterase [Lentisphaeria bacterium]|nr:glycerophosphodiester phosphodiesterase [Lentisphaeria bacterium]